MLTKNFLKLFRSTVFYAPKHYFSNAVLQDSIPQYPYLHHVFTFDHQISTPKTSSKKFIKDLEKALTLKEDRVPDKALSKFKSLQK